MYEVFEQLLQKDGVTSYKVAKEAGVTQTALSNWKSGSSTPTTKTLQKLADYRASIGDYRMQAEYLEKLLETDKRNLNLIKQLGELQEKLKNKPEAIKYYKRFLEVAQQGVEFEKIQAKLAKLENTEMVQEEGLIDKIMRFFNKE